MGARSVTARPRRGRRGGIRWLAVAVAVAKAAAARTRGEPRLRPLPGDAVILAFGNSLTRGTGAEEEESYPAVLETLIGRRVVNAGVPGETTGEGLRRLPGVLEEVDPDLVILCEGGNDFLRGIPPKRVQENLDAMIRAVRRTGADIVLVAVPRPGVFVRPPGLYKDLAEAHSVPVEAEILTRVLTAPALKSDPIHPNAAGYREIARALADLLRRAGAVP